MIGGCGECFLGDNLTCGHGVGIDNAVVDAVYEGDGNISEFGIGDISVCIDGAETEYLSAAADGAAGGDLSGLGVDDIEGTVGYIIVVCPEHLVGVHIPGCGLDILHLDAGVADIIAHCGLKIDSVELAVVADTEQGAFVVDSHDHDGIAAHDVAVFINEVCYELACAGCTVYDVEAAYLLGAVVSHHRIQGVGGIVICHTEGDITCGCAGAGVVKSPGLSIDGVEPGVTIIVVITIDGVADGGCTEGGNCAGNIQVGDNGRIVIREGAPDAVGSCGVKCDITDEVCSGNSFGYGDGCGAGDAVNGGYGDGGGALCNTEYTAVCINGCDGSVGYCEGNALVECFGGKYGVLYHSITACGNFEIVYDYFGGFYGLTDVNVIKTCAVGLVVDGAVLSIGPGEGVLACGKGCCIYGPVVGTCAECELLYAVYEELELIPEVAAAFAVGLEEELNDVAFFSSYNAGYAGRGGRNIVVAALCIILNYLPGVCALGGEVNGAAGYVQSFIEIACYGRLGGIYGRLGGIYGRLGGIYGRFGGIYCAAAEYFYCVKVDGEHIGYVVVTECYADHLACICSGVNIVGGNFAGCGEACDFVAPGLAAVNGYVYADVLCCIGGILAYHHEADLSACFEYGADEPVIRSEGSYVVDVGLGVHHTFAFGDGHFYAEHPLPLVAVAVFIKPVPAFIFGIGFEIPAGIGYGGLGGIYGRYFTLDSELSGDIGMGDISAGGCADGHVEECCGFGEPITEIIGAGNCISLNGEADVDDGLGACCCGSGIGGAHHADCDLALFCKSGVVNNDCCTDLKQSIGEPIASGYIGHLEN